MSYFYLCEAKIKTGSVNDFDILQAATLNLKTFCHLKAHSNEEAKELHFFLFHNMKLSLFRHIFRFRLQQLIEPYFLTKNQLVDDKCCNRFSFCTTQLSKTSYRQIKSCWKKRQFRSNKCRIFSHYSQLSITQRKMQICNLHNEPNEKVLTQFNVGINFSSNEHQSAN